MESNFSSIISKLDSIKRTREDGIDFWMARDLQPRIGYATWEGMRTAIGRARETCRGAGHDPNHHILETSIMIEVGKGAKRPRGDYFLSRFGASLIVMNGDTSKPEIAAAQQYFAVQARRTEVRDIEQRLALRERVKSANKSLSGVAHGAGVPSARFGIFHDEGYKGLYNGIGVKQIKKRKGIAAKEDLLDRAGATELATNFFRITQAEQKIERDGITGEREVTRAHRDVGEEVRRTITRIGGTMPEDLPAEPSIKKLATQRAKQIKGD